MKSIPLGESGLSVSAIAFGGWQAGREYWPGAADADSEAAVRTWATVCARIWVLPELPPVRVTVTATVPTSSLTV